MNCLHGHSHQANQLQRTTDLGYAVFRCQSCGRTFNERTGTPFNFAEVSTDIVFLDAFSAAGRGITQPLCTRLKR